MHYTSLISNSHRHRPPGVLKGAGAIAEYLFGSRTRRREVYYLAEKSCLPVFKLGAMICARRSTLEAWIGRQERQGVH